LEAIKKEFKETFAEEVKEEPKLVGRKKLGIKKKSNPKLKPVKTNSKKKSSKN
jgi:hypothetical protein